MTTSEGADYRELYSTVDVGRIFAVSPKTVIRWAKKKNFELNGVEVLETPGGHIRFRKEQIHELYWKMIEQGSLPENR